MSTSPAEFGAESISEQHQDNLLTYDELSPNHEASYSAALSCLFHFILLLVLAFIPNLIKSDSREMPVVSVVEAYDESTAGSLETNDNTGENDELGDVSDPVASPPETNPQPNIDHLNKPNLKVEDDETVVEDAIGNRLAQAKAIQDGLAALDQRNSQTSNPNGAPASSVGAGRGARAARWILRFDTRSPGNYLAQLGELDAEIAFPIDGDQWRYFTDLASTRTSSTRDLAQENRIYWKDEESHIGVANVLGVRNAPLMVAFLPIELEEEMLRKELAYRGAKEEDILTTRFRAVKRGGKLTIIVIDQTLRDN